MTFSSKLKNKQYTAIWEEYCGFLDVDLETYMKIQKRLMDEQVSIWSKSLLGQKFLKGQSVQTVEAFRKIMRLTKYEDYADMLLQKRVEVLPEEPVLWIETTWEGGCHPVKCAPYTEGMIQNFKRNLLATLVLSRATSKGVFDMYSYEKVLHGFAPLPYLTGIIPLVISDETSLELIPSNKVAATLSFNEKNKLGFKQGIATGIDYFFSMGSVAYYISKSISEMAKSGGSGKSSVFSLSPRVVLKLLKAKSKSKKEERDIEPRDLYDLKSFICAGTDNACYKDELEALWGIRPMEIFMGTEPTCMGTETWNKNGMYFFPDACFYEFIPEKEMLRSMREESYEPKTYLMDEVIVGEKYELVISNFKGGAFVRYRVGDVYRCIGLGSIEDGTQIPRFEFVDRVPNVIDIGGFTRITERAIERVIEIARLSIKEWFAAKEMNEEGHPFLHLYVEMDKGVLTTQAINAKILKEHLGIYFKYMDHDYEDLKHILGMDPLVVTILRCGTFEHYKNTYTEQIVRINPSAHSVSDLLKCQYHDFNNESGGGYRG